MSANRANAAARNRRAGGAEMPPPQQQMNGRPGQRPGQQSNKSQLQAQPPQNPKISVSDAIGLVSLRIGRLEQFMYKINHEGMPSDESDLNLGENDRIVDEDVFRSIVSRIEALEQRVVSVQSSSSNSGPSLSADHPLIKGITDKQQQQQLSIYEVKDLILKMQAFAMETSTSLKALIEQYESDRAYSAEGNNNEYIDSSEFAVESEIVEDNNLTIDGESLKELIKQELSNESV